MNSGGEFTMYTEVCDMPSTRYVPDMTWNLYDIANEQS